MKKHLVFILGLTLLLTACEEQDITSSPAEVAQQPTSEIQIDELVAQANGAKSSTGINFSLGYEQQVLLISRKGDVRESLLLGFTGIEDSRCPINARCITPGAAEVTMSFANRFGFNTLPMCIGACGVLDRPFDNEAQQRMEDEIVFELNNTNYVLVLKDVTPYLEAGVPTVEEDYAVQLQIKVQ
ncbi:hypothetical protein [Aquimarina brevivitae]|uniref:Lipoprotein n=1 Tax=Aquimarina brevivitae TaxID=323412 RepID=A0A4Q7PI52_9FLAO|nr:hypothetical protein [Aquimarina brevivitae]RZT00245.1 hypothetical protein EV197_1481 [Aquimarina brevivitae]